MTDEQRLSDALHEIVPTPPERPERGPAVEERVRRHRRRTAAATVLVAAAVVAAAVAVPAALAGTDGEGEPAATRSTTGALELACPPTDQEPTSPDTLPSGAIAVRLCPGGGTPFDPPTDVLTTDVDQLVALVNEQPEADPAAVCTMEMGRGYQLVFAYEGGETYTVTGELYSCHHLRLGSTTRTGAEAPFRQFLRSLRGQRGVVDPAAPAVAADASPSEVVAAYVDLLNRGDRARASALWQSRVPVRLPAGYTRIDYELEDVHPRPRISAWPDATAVVGLYREVVQDAPVPYRRATFTLGRDENGAFRIVGVNVGQVIDTGR